MDKIPECVIILALNCNSNCDSANLSILVVFQYCYGSKGYVKKNW